MNEINPLNFQNQNIKFKGKTEMPTMEQTISELVTKLKNRDREVPEYGDFRIVSEKTENINAQLPATHFVLEICKPSKNVEGHEKLRDLKAVAYDFPHPYKAEILLATGSKSEIFDALSDEELLEQLPKIFQKLSHDIHAE